MWNLADGQLIGPDALLSESPGNGVTETSVRIVVLDRDDNATCGPRRSNQLVTIEPAAH